MGISLSNHWSHPHPNAHWTFAWTYPRLSVSLWLRAYIWLAECPHRSKSLQQDPVLEGSTCAVPVLFWEHSYIVIWWRSVLKSSDLNSVHSHLTVTQFVVQSWFAMAEVIPSLLPFMRGKTSDNTVQSLSASFAMAMADRTYLKLLKCRLHKRRQVHMQCASSPITEWKNDVWWQFVTLIKCKLIIIGWRIGGTTFMQMFSGQQCAC